MSSNGYRRAELEKQRKKLLRLQQLKNQAHGLYTSCLSTIRAITEPAIQQLIAKDLKQIQQQLGQASQQIESSPQQAKKGIKKLQRRLNSVIAEAEATVKKLSKQQAQARALLESARQNIEAEKEAAEQDLNLMPVLVKSAKAYATLGEMVNTLKEVFGEYVEPAEF